MADKGASTCSGMHDRTEKLESERERGRETCNFGLPRIGQQDIGGLQVKVDDVQLVQVHQAFGHLWKHKQGGVYE